MHDILMSVSIAFSLLDINGWRQVLEAQARSRSGGVPEMEGVLQTDGKL